MLWAKCQPGDTGRNIWAEQEGEGDGRAGEGDHGQGGDGEEGGVGSGDQGQGGDGGEGGAGGGCYQADEVLCQHWLAARFVWV